MKTFAKNLLPEIHVHINPISRDLLLVALFGLMVAIALLTVLVMAVSRL
ncbi:MAG: hypothetical protein JSS79_08035 [Bacteroidetes bacterium]|nr:hypothetical protein [Bacteroidota bacterium]